MKTWQLVWFSLLLEKLHLPKTWIRFWDHICSCETQLKTGEQIYQSLPELKGSHEKETSQFVSKCLLTPAPSPLAPTDDPHKHTFTFSKKRAQEFPELLLSGQEEIMHLQGTIFSGGLAHTCAAGWCMWHWVKINRNSKPGVKILSSSYQLHADGKLGAVNWSIKHFWSSFASFSWTAEDAGSSDVKPPEATSSGTDPKRCYLHLFLKLNSSQRH